MPYHSRKHKKARKHKRTPKYRKRTKQTGGGLLKTLQGHRYSVYSVAAYLTDERVCIVSGSLDNTVKVWDAVSGSCLRTLEGHTSFVMSVAVSSDGTRLISGSYDKTVKVWDADTGACLLTLKGHPKAVYSVTTYTDPTTDTIRIVSGSVDETVQIWDTRVEPVRPIVITNRDKNWIKANCRDTDSENVPISPISYEALEPNQTILLSDGHCYSYSDIVNYYNSRTASRQPFVSPYTRGAFSEEDIQYVKALKRRLGRGGRNRTRTRRRRGRSRRG